MKIFLTIFVSLFFLVAVTGVWKIITPWLIGTVTSLSHVLDKDTSPTPHLLDECRVESNKTLTTPGLIDCAFKNKKITSEQRILYLSYAIGDFAKLPREYNSNEPWDGTMTALELNETVSSKEKFCVLSEKAQEELRRKFPQSIRCR